LGTKDQVFAGGRLSPPSILPLDLVTAEENALKSL
jgi:hypothetical protein